MSTVVSVMAADAETHGSEPTDGELVSALAAGDTDALTTLHGRYAAHVLRTALRVTRDRGLAEEVGQDVFVTLWLKAATFDERVGSLRGWLTTIARNRAIDRVRSRDRHPTYPLGSMGDPDGEGRDPIIDRWAAGDLPNTSVAMPDPVDTALAGEQRDDVSAALEVLTPDERRVIMLAYGEGLSQTQIGARLGWPTGTVKTRTRRALLRLRTELTRPGRRRTGTLSVVSIAPLSG